MPAHDIVGIDLELGLGVELRIRRQHQRLGHLLAIGLLRIGPHDDLALEHAACATIQNALEQLAAFAAGHRVIDDQRRVDVVGAAPEEAAGDIELCILAGERCEHADCAPIPPQRSTGTHDKTRFCRSSPSSVARCVASPASATHLMCATSAPSARVISVPALTCAFAAVRCGADMRLDKRDLSSGLHGNDVARRDRLARSAGAGKHHEHRPIRDVTSADLEQGAVGHESEVQRTHRILAALIASLLNLPRQPFRRRRQHIAHAS